MKIDSPIRISFFVGLILSFLCLLLFNLFTDYGSFFIRILVFIVLSALLLYYILNKLFYEKIRVIHKNIYKFKGTSSVKYLDIGNVEKEAAEWAEAKEKELADTIDQYIKDKITVI